MRGVARRRLWSALAVAAVLVLTATAVVVTSWLPAGRATAGPAQAEQVRLPAGRPILFVGASYTAGLGAHPHTNGYAYLVGRYLNRPVVVDAVSGSGFVNPGPRHQGTFADRIARLPAGLDPGLVVLQGGRNDAGCPRRVLTEAVEHTIAVARHRFRHADLAIIGPIPASLPVGPGVRTVESVLGQVARTDHVVFLDAIGGHWMNKVDVRRYAGPVPGHPNDAGYAYIARRVADALAARN